MKAETGSPALRRTDHNADRGCAIDICIPFYKSDPTELIATLAGQDGAQEAALRIYDDGSDDPAMTARIEAALALFPGRSTLLQADRNRGRAAARNALLNAAESDWILLLDSDTRIDKAGFLSAYRNAARKEGGPCCIVGGSVIDPALITPATALHALQSQVSECLPARVRATDPGRYVFTMNLFLHRTILERIPLDEGFVGWGWEDVDWGLRIAARYPVIHIDNPAVHLGLMTVPEVLRKYRESGPNFVRLLNAHPDAVARMPLYRWARRFAALPGHRRLIPLAAGCARARVLPMRTRLAALKVCRALIHAAALHDAES